MSAKFSLAEVSALCKAQCECEEENSRLKADIEKLRGFTYWVICNARKGGIHGETIMKRAEDFGVVELFDISEAATKQLTGEEND